MCDGLTYLHLSQGAVHTHDSAPTEHAHGDPCSRELTTVVPGHVDLPPGTGFVVRASALKPDTLCIRSPVHQGAWLRRSGSCPFPSTVRRYPETGTRGRGLRMPRSADTRKSPARPRQRGRHARSCPGCHCTALYLARGLRSVPAILPETCNGVARMGVGPGFGKRCPDQIEDFVAQRISGPAGNVRHRPRHDRRTVRRVPGTAFCSPGAGSLAGSSPILPHVSGKQRGPDGRRGLGRNPGSSQVLHTSAPTGVPTGLVHWYRFIRARAGGPLDRPATRPVRREDRNGGQPGSW